MMTAMPEKRHLQTMRLFLASESPRRRELLKKLLSEFEVESAAVEELGSDADLSCEEIAAANAAAKADAVAAKHPGDWVLGADTIVVLEHEMYGKPRNSDDARLFLERFSGKSHNVITAVALRRGCDKRKIDFTAESTVRFRELTPEIIEQYLSLVPVMDKAGAYGIQDHGSMLVESIEGELENIIGLPVEPLKKVLTDIGFELAN